MVDGHYGGWWRLERQGGINVGYSSVHPKCETPLV